MSNEDNIKIKLVNNIIIGEHFIKSDYDDSDHYNNDNNNDFILKNTKNKTLSPHKKMCKVETMDILNSDYKAVLKDIENDGNNNNSNNNVNDYNNNEQKYTKLNKFKNFFHIANEKGISIFLHIFIMACFETYFYFHYVIKLEKKMLMDKINNYLDNMYEYYTNNLDDKEDMYIDFFFKNFYDSDIENYLKYQYENAKREQDLLMNKLIIFCCELIGSIFCFFAFFSLLSFIHKINIKWKWIIVENILTFGLLGLLEYIFLQNVILKYSPFSNEEIKYIVYKEMVKIINGTYDEK